MATIDCFRLVSEKDHIPIIRRDTEDFLKSFIDKNEVKRILEYGTAIGYSAVFFAETNEEVNVFSVEKDEYAFEIAKKNIEHSVASKRIHLLRKDALKGTERILSESAGDFDLIFIDGGKSHYLELIKEAMKLCRVGGHILSDDIWQRGLTKMNPEDVSRKHRTSMKNMKDYLDYICSTSELETEIMDIGDGLAVSKYLGKR